MERRKYNKWEKRIGVPQQDARKEKHRETEERLVSLKTSAEGIEQFHNVDGVGADREPRKRLQKAIEDLQRQLGH